uniref:biotin carboxylase n=1 Tax=uncultured bacterium BAC-AB1442/1414/561 TaxID=1562172 RepID=A0A0C4S492_9BACT|nr:carbamoyl-phosphate synthase large subunit [uncultured bacterium BAC-AB1442/1414/561]
MFDRLLVANRGEIALRVVRTCREMGIPTTAVYSTADADSPVLDLADEAICIGPAASRHSYLNGLAILEAARRTGAQAIHPGYGFLSEDPYFAEMCEVHGITFIGPSAEVMAGLGDKSTARDRMRAAGLSVLPGSSGPLSSERQAADEAAAVGYPVILKAVAGGGGRGMGVVSEPGGMPAAYREVRAAAQAVFGDGRIYLERFVPDARHVEIQVLCDEYGNAVHLGERECSVQRRHQKLIEESPAANVPATVLDEMRRSAVAGALACGYTGAGTFEFLLDADNRHYFIEVNCRIQVEHPVTEMATGVDLIREQISVAAGEPLRFSQEDVQPRGAAVECRINAEDPARGFAPAPGRLETFRVPGGPFTRVDTHAYSGYRVPPDYDSLLAKVITWAPRREQALDRMDRALAEFTIAGPGVRTTVPFLRRILREPSFRRGEHTTSLIAGVLAR